MSCFSYDLCSLKLSLSSSGVHWTVLDQTYLATTSSKPPNSWEKFFSNLGVVHFLAIERKDVQLSKSELVGYLFIISQYEIYMHVII